MASYEELQASIVDGQIEKAAEHIRSFLKSGGRPGDIITEGLIKGMSIVGDKWKAGELFIPEVLRSADVVNKGMEILRPSMVGDQASRLYYKGKFVIGTVEGDVHNIGKNLVSVVLQSGGFEVIDLGVEVSADRFVEAVKREKPDIVGLSALLTLTMPRMREVIEALKRNNLRDKVRVMIGGAPTTPEFAESIGADGHAGDAISALDKAKQLLENP